MSPNTPSEDYTLNESGLPEESVTDPKTGKKINRRKSMLVTAAAAAAGIGLSKAVSDGQLSNLNFDSDMDGQADTLLSDQDQDGIYETAIPIEPEYDILEGIPFNPSTAPVATSVNDEMSFSEAFANAREELGPGGVFEWNGQLYGTFYEDEVDENGNPVIEYDTVENQGQYGSDNQINTDNDQADSFTADASSGEEAQPGAETGEGQAGDDQPDPYIMGLDANSDGAPDAVFVDINLDGSADALYADVNQDGVIGEDEVQFIHDPENLLIPEQIADGTTMSIDTNQDGVDDTILLDANADLSADAIGVDQNQDMQIDESEVSIINQDAMPGSESMMDSSIDYEGEVSPDMPEDVSPEVLDNYTDDTQALEDNFGDINDWA